MTDYRQRFLTSAQQLQEQFQRNMDGIRARRDLTPEARQVAIARAYTKARDSLRAYEQQDREHIARQRAYLERKLFGSNDDLNSSTAVSRRDATDRAVRIATADEAARALNRAHRDGDHDMARAIAAHAAEMASAASAPPGWGQVVHHYAQSKPSLADAYEELASMPDPDREARDNLTITGSYVLPKPSELDRYQNHQVDQLANTDMTIHGTEAA